MGIDLRVITPISLSLSTETVDEFRAKCKENDSGVKGRVRITDNIPNGLQNCDVIYGDVWISMGEKHLIAERIDLLKKYKVTMAIINMT
jgi:ornithine carbamoyltransferase